MKASKICLAMLFAPASFGMLALTGCGSEPSTQVQKQQMINDSQATLKDLEIADPTLADKVNSSVGYAILPSVSSGAVGVKVESGNGEVYLKGNKYIGTAHLGSGGLGVSLGGQTYQELILFETPEALSNFEDNTMKFDATAGATMLQSGAAATAKFNKGILVFKHVLGGAMFDASIGGQQITFKAANPQPAATQP